MWIRTLLKWVNSTITVTKTHNHLNDAILEELTKKLDNSENPLNFLKLNFPNLLLSNSFALSSSSDYSTAATCFLIYVSFSKKPEAATWREEMCIKLDNTTQQYIADFLMGIAVHGDALQLSFESIRKEVISFVKKHDPEALIGDCTPVKNSDLSNCSYESPLQDFFQTPKKSRSENRRVLPLMCGDGDHLKHIKQLENNLAEEELEKAWLQEKLTENMKKCSAYEAKINDKIEEIRQMKHEWEVESKRNEDEVEALKEKLVKKNDDEENLRTELSYFENYVSTLESQLAELSSYRLNLEHQLKSSLDKYTSCEMQLEEVSKANAKLSENLAVKEKELEHLRENLQNSYANGKKEFRCVEESFGENSFNGSIYAPETMDVVVEKLLKDKIEENSCLKESVEELERGKNELALRLEKLREELSLKNSTIEELEFLNKELSLKFEKFDEVQNEFRNVQQNLVAASEEIDKLTKENSRLLNECNTLDSKSAQQEQDLLDCKKAKMLLRFDFLKLSYDLDSVQYRLETEMKNLSKLTLDVNEEKATSDEIKDVPFERTFDSVGETSPKTTKNYEVNVVKEIFSSDEKVRTLQELLNHFESYDREWCEPKASMQRACHRMNDSIISMKLKIADLENARRNSMEERAKLQMNLKAAEEKIFKVENFHSTEIDKFKAEIREKELRIGELEKVISKLNETPMSLPPERDVLPSDGTKSQNDVTFIYEGCDFSKRIPIAQSVPHQKLGNFKKLSPVSEKVQWNDSLEEIPVCSKTFEIISLDEKNATFSLQKESATESQGEKKKNGSSWSVSPPSRKIPPKLCGKPETRRVRGDCWVIPMVPAKKDKNNHKASFAGSELTGVESGSNLTKSSSLSSIVEAASSPLSKLESKTSGATSFFSVTDLPGSLSKKYNDGTAGCGPRKAHSSETCLKNAPSDNSLSQVFRLVEKREDPLGEIFGGGAAENDKLKTREWEKKFSQMRREIVELSNECERLRSSLIESETKRKKAAEFYEKNKESITQSITAKCEIRLEHLKTEMKQLYNRELAKHKAQQSDLSGKLLEQNKALKEHIDDMRNQLWEVREKLLQEQRLKKELEKVCNDLRKKCESMFTSKDSKEHNSNIQKGDPFHEKDYPSQEKIGARNVRPIPAGSFPTIPTEDEDEVFDNMFLEDLKRGQFPSSENPEDRLRELQSRNTLVLPHLKSSYPAETQFHNPSMFKETDLKFGLLTFGQESQSLTDSDHSMTRSLLPENKGKKKEQTSYKKPGPPTPSKNGGRFSLEHNGDFRLTPRNALRELSENASEKSKGTPNRGLRIYLPVKSGKRKSFGGTMRTGSGRDENAAPVTPRKKFFGKNGKILRKPFGARDH